MKQVLGILGFWTSTASGGFFFRNIAAQIGLAYYAVSVFLTAMVTWMICYRILSHGKIIKERLEPEYASPYFAIVALVVESVLPYTLSGIAFLISLGLGSQMTGMFAYLQASLMVSNIITLVQAWISTDCVNICYSMYHPKC